MKRTIAAVAIALIAWPTSAHAEVEPTSEPSAVVTPTVEPTSFVIEDEPAPEVPPFVAAPSDFATAGDFDCEFGWEYPLGFEWDDANSSVTIEHDGATVNIDDAVLAEPGTYKVRATATDGLAFYPDDLRGWTVVSEHDGYATEITMPLTVEFGEAPDCTVPTDDDEPETDEPEDVEPIADEPELTDDEPELPELVTAWNQTIN